MIFLFFSILFVFGLSIGSFLNALEYRLYHKIDFVKQRSMCTSCKHVLGPLDLIPLVSFALIRGKCRYCGTKVSWQYPIIEFLSGMLFILSGWYVLTKMQIQGISDLFLMICTSIFLGIIFVFFLFIALYDVKHKIIPNSIIIPGMIFAFFLDIIFTVMMHFYPNSVIFTIFTGFDFLWNIAAGISGGIFIASIIFVTKGKGMGGGDLKLVTCMGLLLGIQNLVISLYVAVILGSIGGIVWGLHKGKIKGLQIPFGLFLSVGTIISLVFGDSIWSWYATKFLGFS